MLSCRTHTSFDKQTSENKQSSQEPGPTSTAFSVSYTFESTEVDLEAEWQLSWQQQWQLGMWTTLNPRHLDESRPRNFAITIISHELLPSLPPLPRCDLDSACKVWNVIAFLEKSRNMSHTMPVWDRAGLDRGISYHFILCSMQRHG